MTCQLRLLLDIQCVSMARFTWNGNCALVLVYSPSEDSWEVIPTPTKRYMLATYHSQLVLVGGWNPHLPTNKVWLLDDSSWVPHPTVPDMPFSTAASPCVGFDDYLVVSGNEQTVEGSKAVAVFDGHSWFSGQVLPESVYWMKSVSNGDDWYFFSRDKKLYRTSLKSLVASAVSPSAAAQSAVWERLPDTPQERSGITWFGDHLLAVGGRNSDRKEMRSVYAYNAQANVWELVSDLPGDGCHDSCCAVLPTGELLVVGGCRTVQRILKATIRGTYIFHVQ